MNNYYLNDPFIRTFMMPAIENNFINADEGFLKGNMEKETYVPYKNMTYIKPTITSERQRDLYELQKVCFAAHDANLYLDTHPNDKNMIELYNKYLKKEKELESAYENKYGPLELSYEGTTWSWIDNPWPWSK